MYNVNAADIIALALSPTSGGSLFPGINSSQCEVEISDPFVDTVGTNGNGSPASGPNFGVTQATTVTAVLYYSLAGGRQTGANRLGLISSSASTAGLPTDNTFQGNAQAAALSALYSQVRINHGGP
jgi:hypothetical protein